MDRRWTLKIHYVLDQLVPPALRDCGWLMKPLLRLALGRHTPVFTRFKERAFHMSHAEFADCYRQTAGLLPRETDLNPACAERILRDAAAGPVLEVGCGSGWLAERLAAAHGQVTAVDIAVTPRPAPAGAVLRHAAASAECLPFADRSFATVICTHTLEHVRDLPRAVAELRRVARERLIVVVPRQRPYRYTFDLHLHFFPYPFQLVQALRPAGDAYECVDLAGDLYFCECLTEKSADADFSDGRPGISGSDSERMKGS